MFWKKQKNLELENYIMDLEDRVRNLKRRIHEANVKMGFTEDKKTAYISSYRIDGMGNLDIYKLIFKEPLPFFNE